MRPLPVGETVLPPSMADTLRDARIVERAGDFARIRDGTVVRVRGAPLGWTTAPDPRLAASAVATEGATECAALDRIRCAEAWSSRPVAGPASWSALTRVDALGTAPHGVAQVAARAASMAHHRSTARHSAGVHTPTRAWTERGARGGGC